MIFSCRCSRIFIAEAVNLWRNVQDHRHQRDRTLPSDSRHHAWELRPSAYLQCSAENVISAAMAITLALVEPALRIASSTIHYPLFAEFF